MNAKQITRDLRRLAQREVAHEPDLWPAVRARLARAAGTNPSRDLDGTSTYVWHTDADVEHRRWRTARRIAGASLALLVLVVVLAALFSQQDGDQQPVAIGGQSSPTASSVALAIPSATTAIATPTSTDFPFPVTSLTSPAQPSTCTASSIGQLLANFVDAFNAGDQARLRALLPNHDSDYFQSGVARDQYSLFQMFNQNEFLGPASWGADNRADLLQEFAQRHAAHEHWTMVSLKYGQVTNNAAFIQPTFTAQADDLSLRTFQGRGAINCDQGWITTWVASDTEVLTAPSPTNTAPPPSPDTDAPFTLPPLPALPSVPADRLGSSCGPQDAGALTLRFIKAVNDGDQATLATLFPDDPSVTVDLGEGLQWTADGRDDLLSKLTQLRQQGTWEGKRIIAASQPHGAAIQFDINVISGDNVIFTLSGVGLVNCDNQQIVAWQMTESPPFPVRAATPSADAPLRLEQADVVWRSASDGIGATIDPILRPNQLPPGFDFIRLGGAVPGFFDIEYQGAKQDLTVGAGAFNPPPAGPNGSQQQITVRGQPATLQINDTTQPSQRVWLWWQEPGTWEHSGLVDPTGIFYLISAHGLTPDQVIQIANELRPVSANGAP